ncbi:hypothetical protein Tco_0969975 [Tanacetum coccineum]
MSQPANDVFSQHLSNDEASFHVDASEREMERKARTILLMAIPKENLRRFHGMDDAKEIREAIRTSTYTPSTSSYNIPKREVPAGFADEVIYITLLSNNQRFRLASWDDLEQID